MSIFVKLAFQVVIALILVMSAATLGYAATFINMGTASVSGIYYPVGAAMCKIWNDNIPDMKANVQATGGTVQNLQLIGRGDAELIFTDGSVYDAYNGTGKYDGKAQKYLRGLVPVYAEPVNFMVAKDSGITDVCNTLAEQGYRVIVAGLDMDFRGNPFGPMPALMAIADDVTKEHAVCVRCGAPAYISHRTVAGEKQVLLGETDKYEPICRCCYSKEKQKGKKD